MHLLPLSLGRLADVAVRPGWASPYALDVVSLRLLPDDAFEAVATDTKCLARVRGPCPRPAAEYPLFPELEQTADTESAALVPAEAWKRVFRWAGKLVGRRNMPNPACQSVAVRIGPTETAFGVSDDHNPWLDVAQHVPGRFPNYNTLLDNCLAEPNSADRFDVDPLLLAGLLRTAAEFAPDPDNPAVTVEAKGPRKPVVVRTGQPGGIEFVGILMPLTT